METAMNYLPARGLGLQGLQGVTGVYRRLKGVTGNYKGLRKVTGG